MHGTQELDATSFLCVTLVPIIDLSLASGGSSGTRSTRASVITDRKSLSRRYSAVLRVYTVYTWPTEFVVAGVVVDLP